MSVDWFTVLAQGLNFLVLVWLLKRFLYRPVLSAIDAREQRVRARFAEAEAARAAAEAERASLSAKTAELERQRASWLERATSEADAERTRLFQEARRAADEWTARQDAARQREAGELAQALGTRVQREVFALAHKAISDLADVDLEQRIAERLLARLRELGGDEQAELRAALRQAAEPIVVRSAFALTSATKERLQEALHATLGSAGELRFETDPSLVCGLELSTRGQRVCWNVTDYLGTLEHDVRTLLERAQPT